MLLPSPRRKPCGDAPLLTCAAGKNLDLYLCANRTCEVGMEHATHAPYESFVYALEELTSA